MVLGRFRCVVRCAFEDGATPPEAVVRPLMLGGGGEGGEERRIISPSGIRASLSGSMEKRQWFE